MLQRAEAQDAASPQLFPMREGNRWGYIDTTGKTIIDADYHVALPFSEELAAVREDGLYGYINNTGDYVIEPKFSAAFSFAGGIAKVFVDSVPYLIDHNGKVLFNHKFATISELREGSLSIVSTHSGCYGAVDRTGKLVVDTMYTSLGAFEHGVSVVVGLHHLPYDTSGSNNEVYEVGVIDTLGNMVVEYGRYEDIGNFRDGVAEAHLIKTRGGGKGRPSYRVMIDAGGNELFTILDVEYSFEQYSRPYSEGLAAVRLNRINEDGTVDRNWRYGEQASGVVDLQGKLLFSNKSWCKITPFNHGRAFAELDHRRNRMIDRHGNYVGDSVFAAVLLIPKVSSAHQLDRAIAFTMTSSGWSRIDSNGSMLDQPVDLRDWSVVRVGNTLVLNAYNEGKTRYGIWRPETSTLIPPIYDFINSETPSSPLIQVVHNGVDMYLDSQGKTVWRGHQSKKLKPVNIDFLNRGHFNLSRDGVSKRILNFGLPEDIAAVHGPLQVIIDTKGDTSWQSAYEGVKVYVVNRTNEDIRFVAQDGRISMKVQALDAAGTWRDIEHLPNSWCGNSYYDVILNRKTLWEFTMPVYEGSITTKIRVHLETDKDFKGVEQPDVYSNEIDASVNPGQFWNKREYFPQGIMDPYND